MKTNKLIKLLKSEDDFLAIFDWVINNYGRLTEKYNITLFDDDVMLLIPRNIEHYQRYCLVAHIDTVYHKTPSIININKDKRGGTYLQSQSGIGGDDRCGIASALEIANNIFANKQYNKLPIILLTNREEQGCIGVSNFLYNYVTGVGKDNELHKLMTKQIKAFIGLDRAVIPSQDGTCYLNNFVFYDEFYEWYHKYSTRFIDYINGYDINYDLEKEYLRDSFKALGYIESNGTTSDVAVLSDELLIPHINISVGYYNQHQRDKERIYTKHLNDTIEKLTDFLLTS